MHWVKDQSVYLVPEMELVHWLLMRKYIVSAIVWFWQQFRCNGKHPECGQVDLPLHVSTLARCE